MYRVICFLIFCAVWTLPSYAESIEYSIARGGRLYDKWFTENRSVRPKMIQPSYPRLANKSNAKDSWRCKECHGWDYLGKDGAYSDGVHYTGIAGISGYKLKSDDEVLSILKNEVHVYGKRLKKQDLLDLSAFITLGQIDMNRYIDRSTGLSTGDKKKGEGYYQTVCASCHGLDGTEEEVPLGQLSNINPWKVLHKTLYGHPRSKMPALIAFGVQPSIDVLAYLQTLN